MASGVPISKRILLINSTSSLVRRVLSLSVLFWMHQRLVRGIPIEEYALLPVLTGVIAFTPLLTTVLAGGLGRYLTEAYARGERRRVTQIVSSMAPCLLGAALLLLAVGVVFTAHIGQILKIEPEQVATAKRMFGVLLGATVVRVALAPYDLGFYIRQRFVHRDLIGVAFELLRMGLLVFLLTQYETRVEWVVVASTVAGMLELAVVFVWSRRLLPELRFQYSEMRIDVLRPVVSFGGWTILGQTSNFIRETADPLILNHFGTATDVTTFNLGSTIDRNLRRTVFSASSVAQPAATALAATGQVDRLRRIWFRTSRYSLWVMMAAAVPLVVFRDDFFRLYLVEAYEANRNASLVLALLLTRLVVLFPNAGTGMVTIARVRMRSAALRSIGLELTNLALTLALVGIFSMGSTGAALSTCLVALLLHPFVLWTLGLQTTEARLADWLRSAVFPGFLPALAGIPIWTAAQLWLPSESWFELGLAVIPGFLVYALVLWRALRPEDREDLRTVLARFRP